MAMQPKWRRVLGVVAAAAVGCVLGVGTFGVSYSEATSYLGSDPQTCANCHVMQSHYDDWSRGPHAHVATCDDCHLPHDSIVDKYVVQLEDGWLHGSKFTTGDYPTNIVIRDSSLAVVNSSCQYCHQEMTTTMGVTHGGSVQEISCVRCHADVGH
jgi:cytochrome c nitrite reductase small subunit